MTDTTRIPLFPLLQPLFPGTRISLQIFEQRYLRMITECLKKQGTFGVVPILEGSEVGAVPKVHPWGVTADIVDWNQLENGLLGIVIEGGRRFQLHSSEVEKDGLVIGDVQLRPLEVAVPLDDSDSDLEELLAVLAEEFYPDDYHWEPPEDSNTLGWQLAQLLPVEPVLPISLLELDDPLERLERIRDWLDTVSQSEPS
ncbi:MAG: LON peptidase substrate-binding domain-containing protein [Porticoccaceae bacterium]